MDELTECRYVKSSPNGNPNGGGAGAYHVLNLSHAHGACWMILRWLWDFEKSFGLGCRLHCPGTHDCHNPGNHRCLLREQHDHSKDPLGWEDIERMIRKWLGVEGSSKCWYLFRHMKELRHIVGLLPLLGLSRIGE